MREYYIEVLERGNTIYLNDYLLQMGYFDEKEENEGNSKGKAKVKATKQGMVYARKDEENAYVNALILPSIIALAYLITLVVYFIFFR